MPLTLCRIEPDTEAVVCELAMRGMGQIAYLAEIGRPDVAVITASGRCTSSCWGRSRRWPRPRPRSWTRSAPGDTAVVPYGEPLLAPYLDVSRAPRDHVRRGRRAPTCASPAFGAGRAEFARLRSNHQVPVNFDQRHNALNLAAALAACDGLGLPADADCSPVPADVQFSRWRGEQIDAPRRRRPDRRLLQRQPDVDGGGAAPPGRRLPAAAAPSPSSATWPSSAPAGPALHDRVGALARSAGRRA